MRRRTFCCRRTTTASRSFSRSSPIASCRPRRSSRCATASHVSSASQLDRSTRPKAAHEFEAAKRQARRCPSRRRTLLRYVNERDVSTSARACCRTVEARSPLRRCRCEVAEAVGAGLPAARHRRQRHSRGRDRCCSPHDLAARRACGCCSAASSRMPKPTARCTRPTSCSSRGSGGSAARNSADYEAADSDCSA